MNADPELRVFGSPEEKRSTNAGNALIDKDYCLESIISIAAIKIALML